MATLETFVPTMHFNLPQDHQFEKIASTVSTAPYHPSTPLPDQQGRPAFIVHDASLPGRMLESLRTYLQTAPGHHHAPSAVLTAGVAGLPRYLRDFQLIGEPTTTTLFSHAFAPICCAVEEVDTNPTQPRTAAQASSHNQIPDALYLPTRSAAPQLHVEFKSWSVFRRHAQDILQMGRDGVILELQPSETGSRSIIFKVSMLESKL